jgi:hypothetical protein
MLHDSCTRKDFNSQPLGASSRRWQSSKSLCHLSIQKWHWWLLLLLLLLLLSLSTLRVSSFFGDGGDGIDGRVEGGNAYTT